MMEPNASGQGPSTPERSEWDAPTERWLLTGYYRSRQERTVLLELAARIVFPTVLVLSIYLLFAGHDRTGGGFSGGLVAGQAFLLRYLAGGQVDDSARFALRPPTLIGLGLTIATVISFLPVLLDKRVLESAIYKLSVPLLGEVKFVTSIFLDVGVYVLIVGVVLELLRTLGSRVEADTVTDAGGQGP